MVISVSAGMMKKALCFLIPNQTNVPTNRYNNAFAATVKPSIPISFAVPLASANSKIADGMSVKSILVKIELTSIGEKDGSRG